MQLYAPNGAFGGSLFVCFLQLALSFALSIFGSSIERSPEQNFDSVGSLSTKIGQKVETNKEKKEERTNE